MKSQSDRESDIINVLVFPCGSENAMEIHTALKSCVNIRVFGASGKEDHGAFVFHNYLSGIPYIQDSGFIDHFNAVLSKNSIDIVFPTHDTVALFFAENRSEINAKIVMGDLYTCRVCRDKGLLQELFAEHDFCTSAFVSADQINGYPVFLKPRDGQGGKGTFVAKNKKELLQFLEGNPNHLILEYLPGEEYTVDCFTDRHGVLRFVGPRIRARVWAGISVNSKKVALSWEIENIAQKINKNLSFRGLWFFQVKKDKKGVLKLLEVSTRTGGTMNLYRNLGVNFPLLTVYDLIGRDVEILPNDFEIEVDRALFNRYRIGYEYNIVYIDFDDTIVVNGHVNPFMMMCLYSLINKGKKIVLLTRHEGNLPNTLSEHRISPTLFDQIIHLKSHEKKSSYVTKSKSIFIDNAFSERKEVMEICRIPVFDVDAVQSLLDWRE